MDGKIKVWGRVTSSNVKKILWLADELELAIDRIDAGGKFGVVDTPAYRAINPNGRVPTIEDGDFVLWESNAIMRYLCEQYGGTDFYPADPRPRADINRWLDWSLSVLVSPDTRVFLATVRVPKEKHDAAEIAKLTDQAAKAYAILEQHLKGRKYAAADRFSLADITLSIYIDRWLRNPHLSVRQDYPNCEAWLSGIRAERAGFRRFVEIPLE